MNMTSKFVKLLSTLLVLFAAKFSYALTPLVDDALSDVSGQSGLTVEMNTHGTTTIDEFRYTDENLDPDELIKGGSLSLRDIKLYSTKFSVDFDVTATEAILKLNSFSVTDMSFGAIQFNYDPTLAKINPLVLSSEAQKKSHYGGVGALYVNDFTIHKDAGISFKINTAGDFLFNTLLPAGSFFYLTYTDDDYDANGDSTFAFDTNGDGETSTDDIVGKNYISAKVVFDDFNIKDITFSGKEDGAGAYLEVTLGDTDGAIAFNDININGKVIGSAGLENIKTDPVSYLHIRGH